MSSDESPNVPAERDRREAVREKAQQVKVRQSRVRALRFSSLIVGAVAVVAVIAVGVSLAVSSAASRPQLEPSSALNGGFTVPQIAGSAPTSTPAPSQTAEVQATGASPSPAVTAPGKVDIRVYVDYLSPGAKQFQVVNSPQLSTWVNQGAATLTYYPVAMLTSKSNGTKYSLRAASASACVATYAPAAFSAFNDTLLTRQPAADSDGYSDAELAKLAVDAGAPVSGEVKDCILAESFAVWAKAATDRALEGLPETKSLTLTGVPTVLVNGSVYAGALDDPKEFAQFVLMLSSDAYYGTSTPTPSPTVVR